MSLWTPAMKLLTLAALPLLLASAPGTAPQASRTAVVEPPVTPPGDMVVTHGRVATGGRTLSYTVHAGTIPIVDNDTGRLQARMFIMAYTVAAQPGAPPRPLTFIWNGGPGASSSQTQLIGFAPRGFETPPTYPEWKTEPTRIAARPETWLATSDLVFVDPIGTGYSRAVSDSDRDLLYTTFGDAESVAEMIRIYRTRFNAFDQPVFLAGESYGTTRAMYVADALARRRTPVAGVILLSGSYDAGQKVSPALSKALEISLFTATAWYHRRLPKDLQALSQDAAIGRADQWARTVYAPALARASALTAGERAEVLAGLERYTGLERNFIDSATLVISKDDFCDHLLAARGLELGRYDTRITAPARSGGTAWSPRDDPSLMPMIGLMEGTSPALIDYLRITLGYRSDLLYHGPWGGAFHPEPFKRFGPASDDWMAVMWDRHSPGNHAREAGYSPLREAMLSEPRMLVFTISGLYDASCAERAQEVAATDPELRVRVRMACYPAGHMVYTDGAVRRKLAADFAAFVADATAPKNREAVSG
jgi:carboxypeptidase C (cathepsin A)